MTLGIFLTQLLLMTGKVECTSLPLNILRQKKTDSRGGSLARRADVGSEKHTCETVKPHLEVYYVCGHNAWIGAINHYTLVFQFLGEFYGEKRNGKL